MQGLDQATFMPCFLALDIMLSKSSGLLSLSKTIQIYRSLGSPRCAFRTRSTSSCVLSLSKIFMLILFLTASGNEFFSPDNN